MSGPGEPPVPATELVRVIDQGAIDRYAEVSGDRNPLHIDPAFAARTQFGGTVAHGMLLLAYVSEALAQACGRPWLERGRMRARFRAPARPGDTVRVRVTARGQTAWQVEVVDQRGQLLVTAEAEVPPAPA